jgi:hypothetical protein
MVLVLLSSQVVSGFSVLTLTETVDGTLWHGRNLDWNLPDGMRNLTFIGRNNSPKAHFIAKWTKNGQVLFQSVQYAGYVGVLTGIRNGAFGVSINERSLGGSVGFLLLQL